MKENEILKENIYRITYKNGNQHDVPYQSCSNKQKKEKLVELEKKELKQKSLKIFKQWRIKIMEKFTRDITFEGINEEIRETLEELGYANIEYLENFCIENGFELIVKTQSYKPHEENCAIGWNDIETSENISDALLSLYDCNYTDDNDLIYDIYIDNGVEKTFVKTLDIKDYTGLVIVDEHGIETNSYDNDFVNAIINKVDESLNNGNLQDTTLYKSIFKTQEDINDDEKYNTNYNYLIDRVIKSVKHYMLEDSEHRFDVDVSEHFVSCYFFYEMPTIKDYCINDITDVMQSEDL